MRWSPRRPRRGHLLCPKGAPRARPGRGRQGAPPRQVRPLPPRPEPGPRPWPREPPERAPAAARRKGPLARAGEEPEPRPPARRSAPGAAWRQGSSAPAQARRQRAVAVVVVVEAPERGAAPGGRARAAGTAVSTAAGKAEPMRDWVAASRAGASARAVSAGAPFAAGLA